MSIWHSDDAIEATRQLVMLGWQAGRKSAIKLLCGSCKKSEWDNQPDGKWMPYRKENAETVYLGWIHNDGTLCKAYTLYEDELKRNSPIIYS